jgi:hypothetical protein
MEAEPDLVDGSVGIRFGPNPRGGMNGSGTRSGGRVRWDSVWSKSSTRIGSVCSPT